MNSRYAALFIAVLAIAAVGAVHAEELDPVYTNSPYHHHRHHLQGVRVFGEAEAVPPGTLTNAQCGAYAVSTSCAANAGCGWCSTANACVLVQGSASPCSYYNAAGISTNVVYTDGNHQAFHHGKPRPRHERTAAHIKKLEQRIEQLKAKMAAEKVADQARADAIAAAKKAHEAERNIVAAASAPVPPPPAPPAAPVAPAVVKV